MGNRKSSFFVGLVVLVLMSMTTWAQNGSIEALQNADWSRLENGQLQNWRTYEGAYAIQPKAGQSGSTAIMMERDENAAAQGIAQTVVLNQSEALPITFSGWSKAENVSGAPDNDYALYLDMTYADGTNEWGVNAPFATGTHGWQRAEIRFAPKKPIQSVSALALFRKHTGRVWFSDLSFLATVPPPHEVPRMPVQATIDVTPKPYVAVADAKAAAIPLLATPLKNRLQNGDFEKSGAALPASWSAWETGGKIAPNEGRSGAAFFAERGETNGERGVQQTIVLNQKERAPVVIEGWSKAENVSGTPDNHYSIYADVTYADGSSLWGVNAPFETGTHDWQSARTTISPSKPIRAITIYALFRHHTGRAWFDDFSASTQEMTAGGAFLDGVAITAKAAKKDAALLSVSTQDGLTLRFTPQGDIASLKIDGRETASGAAGGFLARDVANHSGFYRFEKGESAPLKLNLQSKTSARDNHIIVEGSLKNAVPFDRAVTLLFALPINADGWTFDDDMRSSRAATGNDEYSSIAPIGAGAGGLSVYPLANLRDEKSGLAIAIDMAHAAQYRLAYNNATKQFYIAYDFGFTPQKSSADFRFVIYKTAPQPAFRDALARLYTIFPTYFALRDATKKQGIWMPFNRIDPIEKPEDFGFRFREAGEGAEGDGSAAWDDAHDVLTLLYSEPMTFWMALPATTPRTYEAALLELGRIAADEKHAQSKMARAVIASGMRNAQGQIAHRFIVAPWADGVVWNLSVAPHLSTQKEPSGATLVWNEAKRARLRSNANGKIDGEYLDSLNGYVTDNLNYARGQFASSKMPLTFDSTTFAPAQHKSLLANEMTRWMSTDIHSAGGLLMANAVPYEYSYHMPWLDIAGTETNWKIASEYSPDSDAAMNLRRALSGPKPYVLLQNTNFKNFTNADVKRYMERCLFYGVFPGFFSENAATDVYFGSPALYNRDRALFKTYIPLVRAVAEAGWQPLTRAASANKNIWLERFGNESAIYFTLRNNASTQQTARIALERGLTAKNAVRDLLKSADIALQNGAFEITLQPDETRAIRVQ